MSHGDFSKQFLKACFYKKLGSGRSIKSFLIWHEILSILVLKSFLIGFLFFECRIINVVAKLAADTFLDI